MNSPNSNFNYSFKFKDDENKKFTILEFPVPPERINIGVEQEEISKTEKFACFVNRMSTDNKNFKEASELNPILTETYGNYQGTNYLSSIQMKFENFGSLPDDSLQKNLKYFESEFKILYNWNLQILSYLKEAEARNYILETIEIEQILYYNKNLKILPDIERIKECYFIQNNYKFSSRGSDGEAPELYNGPDKSNIKRNIENPRKLVVYSFGILFLKLFNLLDESEVERLKEYKTTKEKNENIVKIALRLFEKYKSKYFGNPDDLKKFKIGRASCRERV